MGRRLLLHKPIGGLKGVEHDGLRLYWLDATASEANQQKDGAKNTTIGS